MTNPVPAVIGGKYRLVRRLGQGSMGSVFEAHTDAGQRVAVKVITADVSASQTLLPRFEREARAAFTLRTPHICRALDAGTDASSGMPYLVMELLQGEDLDQLEARFGPLPPDLALRITAQACLALREAHAAGVLHRDIKPANLFLAIEGNQRVVKLLDFGVAKVRNDLAKSSAETPGLTRTGSMLGSPLYMSPEQARGLKDIDFRADLWSLGVVLYKMLSGRAPHDDTRELGELIVLICTEAAKPIQDLAPWVPPEVAAIVHKALKFKPKDRWASADEMHAAICALLRGNEAIADHLARPLTAAEKAVIAPRLTNNENPPVSRRKPAERDGAPSSRRADNPPPALPVGLPTSATLPLTDEQSYPQRHSASALPFSPATAPQGGAARQSPSLPPPSGQPASGQPPSREPGSPWAAAAPSKATGTDRKSRSTGLWIVALVLVLLGVAAGVYYQFYQLPQKSSGSAPSGK